MALEITVKEVDSIDVVSLNGTLTTGTTLSIAETKIQKLIESGHKRVVLDLSQVSYSDSAGLGMLVNAHGVMESHGGELRFAAANDKLRRLFQLTHTDRIFEVDADVQAALNHLRQAKAGA
ncbi:MAG: STAS domain-containing protein [Acidobacteriales bacterium]|nr:STAS domain-containing protein [Terriglobales bacterium]